MLEDYDTAITERDRFQDVSGTFKEENDFLEKMEDLNLSVSEWVHWK